MPQNVLLNFELLFNSMPGSFLVLQPNAPHYTILTISDEFLQNTNKKRAEVVGKGLFEVYPDKPDPVRATVPSNLRTSLLNAVEKRVPDHMPLVRHDVPLAVGGVEVRYWSANIRPVEDSQGKLLYILYTTSDVTAQMQTNKGRMDLQSIEKKYSLFMEAPLAVCILSGADNIIELSNDDMLRFYNKTKDIMGQPLFEAIPEAKGQGFAEMLEQVRATGQTHTISEYPTKMTVKGQEALFYYNIVLQPYHDGPHHGQPSGIFSVAHDVTELVLAKQRVEESEARLQAIIEATPECIKIVTPEGKLQYMNSCGLKMIEGDEDLLGKANVIDVIAPEHQARWKENHLRVCAGNSLSWEFDIVGLKGTRRRMETHAVPLAGAGGSSQLAVTRDITKRKASEAALQESEEQFRNFANNIENLAWMAAPDGDIYWYNARWYEYTGTNLEEMRGWGWEKVHHPDYVDSVVTFAKQAWKLGETWELTFPLRGANGEYQWFLTRAYAVKDEQRNILRWIGTNTNINNQKKAEASLEAKNIELVRINNDLDNFIYTASHDLKAPISNIEGLLAMLSEQLNGQELHKADTDHIIGLMQASVERFKRTIMSLTDLVKLQQESTNSVTAVHLRALVEEVLQELEPDIKATSAQMKVEVSEDTRIHFSEKNLRSIVLNLVSNAVKYAAADRVPHVAVRYHESADYQVITVQDNGLGLSTQNQEQLFTMFKRFHDHVEGTGIGLYMVKKMVESAAGYITVSSEEGIGTEVSIFLKRSII